jgi:Uma2 family endonuclease
MSTIHRAPNRIVPPLVEGERLDQATFHERYEAMPPGTRAELIGGLVYMPSPVGVDHGRGSAVALAWLARYEQATPGVETLDNVSAALDDRGEPQPDAVLRILPEYGGQTSDETTLVRGSPELVVEVAVTSETTDLGPKRVDYERAGVREYIVVLAARNEVAWYRNVDGALVRVASDDDGVFRSTTFPGLWLDPKALLARDWARLNATVDAGIATEEHRAFVDELQARRARS